MELPLPHDDPGDHRRRATGPSPPTSSGSAAPTSPPPASDYTYQRHVDWMRAVARGARPPRHHARLPGLGRPHRPPARGRARRTGSPGSSPPTRSCPPATRPPARRSSTGRTSRRRSPDFAVGQIVNFGIDHRSHARGRSPRTTRRSPTTRYKAGRPPVPDARPDVTRRSRRRRRTARPGRCSSSGRSRSSPRSPTRTRSPRAATRVLQARIPGAAGQPHTTIDGGGHFLQEDRGPGARPRRRRLHPRHRGRPHEHRPSSHRARRRLRRGHGPRLARPSRDCANVHEGGRRTMTATLGTRAAHPPTARRVVGVGRSRSRLLAFAVARLAVPRAARRHRQRRARRRPGRAHRARHRARLPGQPGHQLRRRRPRPAPRHRSPCSSSSAWGWNYVAQRGRSGSSPRSCSASWSRR